jgi:PAS domain S-box-containing protein
LKSSLDSSNPLFKLSPLPALVLYFNEDNVALHDYNMAFQIRLPSIEKFAGKKITDFIDIINSEKSFFEEIIHFIHSEDATKEITIAVNNKNLKALLSKLPEEEYLLLSVISDSEEQELENSPIGDSGYREIFEQANQVIYIHNYDTLAFEDVNQKALEVFGKTKEEMLQSDGSEFVSGNPGYTLEDAVEKLMKAKTEGPQVFDWESKLGDGSICWTEVRIQKIKIGGQDKIITFFSSIDDRKKAEQELKRVNDENKKILDSSLDIILTVDENGEFVKISAACEKIWGYKPTELIGKKYIDLVHPDYHDISTKIHNNILNGINENYFKNVYIRKDGKLVPMVWTATWDTEEKLFFAVARDASEFIKAEQALHESEERYRHLFIDNPSPMFIWDFETYKIVECNKKALEKYGYSKEEFIGKSILDIRPIEDIELIKWVSSNEEIYGRPHNRRWRHLKKDGTLMYVEVSGNIINYKGRKSSFVAVNDVTEKVKTEELLKQSEKKLRTLNAQLEKKVEKRNAELIETNRQLEAFSYSISHDLKSPLRTINVFSQILQKKMGENLTYDSQELIKTIQDNCLQMTDMIEKMLYFSKTGKKNLTKESIDVNQLLNQLIESMDIHQNNQLTINISQLPECFADRTMLKQIFANLISNAVKYSSKKNSPVIEIGAQEEKNCFVYFVKDNGTGFDDKYSSKLFQVFKRLHSNHEFDGTGVGLAIVKQIVEKHGGKVWAESKLGHGATFYFSIPKK